uniref:Uncharacterized protein n=1 Tax=Arundo donax TaxID=35708 RepID=A0A0A8ZCP3_ARUDO
MNREPTWFSGNSICN